MHACYPPCEVCREREERATQPAPQAGSSGEGLKVGDEVTPAQAEPVAVCECGKQYAKIDEVTYCPDCTTAMTGLTEAELRQALAEPVVDNEVWDCDCGVVNDWIEETCIVCESPRPKLSPQPVEAKEPWKPVVGEKVLVEAVVVRPELGRFIVEVKDLYFGPNDTELVMVELSQLRPLPVVQGEGEGK